ncbi:MAG TPA: cation diffusion facilitator family transporter [Pseudonocardiaceae bacterium]|jgi:cation diffusion facilitator family transporter|nr:cation diffusion facilitator family transporter [Pseudonocardiaceae bacterium]
MAELEGSDNSESLGTVLVAAGANLAIAVAKAVGGILSGSSAMLAEAAHSVADTVTEVLLLTALRRSARPPDARHPLGYGPERYFWAFLASVATFIGGAVFAVTDGIRTILGGEDLGDPLVSYIVLGIAFVLEGTSLLRGVRQTSREARRWRTPLWTYIRHMPDTTVKAVVFEDTAAIIGLVLAAVGLVGGFLTGSRWFDGVASILIGATLAFVAFTLGRDNMSLLIGRSVPERVLKLIRKEINAPEMISGVGDLAAILLGPNEVLVAAKVDFVDTASAGQVEDACEEVERRLGTRFPAVRQVFLDPTANLRATSDGTMRPSEVDGQSPDPAP